MTKQLNKLYPYPHPIFSPVVLAVVEIMWYSTLSGYGTSGIMVYI